MSAVPNDWPRRLAAIIAVTLRECVLSRLQDTHIVAFDVGCFPWHGLIELSVLTTEEAEVDPLLLEPRTAASWRHYNFSAGFASFEPAVELGRQMAVAYNAVNDDSRETTTDAFLRACAAAVASPEVAAALAPLNRNPNFKISVTHPDDGREFYPPPNTVPS